MINIRKYYFIAGLFGLLGLMILAVIFFKERIAFSDMAYQAVFLLIEQRPFVVVVRAGSILPQFVPLMAIWLHAGLKTVMIFHSLSFFIFFTIIYLLAYRYSVKRLMFFVIPLYLVLITNEVFYWPQSELQQGMIWLCLYTVLLFEKKWNSLRLPLNLLIHFLFILWIQFFHPLIFFPIAFVLIYYYDSERELFSWRSVYHMIICLMAFGIRAEVGRYNPYEKGKLEIGKALRHNLPHFFSLDSVNVFLGKLPSVYLVYVLVLAGAILFLLIRKHYLRALTVLGFTLGYWLLIMVSSPLDARFYTENMLLPLAFIAAVPVVADILPEMKFSYAPALFLIIILIRMGGIYAAHRDYTAHYEVYDPYFKYVKEKKLNGVFVENKLVDQKKAIVTWASGYESILISSLASPDSCRVVQIMEDPKSMEPQLGNDSTLVTIYGFWSRSQLGDRYFKLPGGKYEIITEQP